MNEPVSSGAILLERLAKNVKAHPQHAWKEYADLIRDCGGIVDASCNGFKVNLGDGIRAVEFKGGLTAEHYFYFAPLLEEWDRADLARAVLRNKTRRSYLDSELAWSLLALKYGKHLENWLPQQVAVVGFSAIAHEIEEALSNYRQEQPTRRIKKWRYETPRFNHKSGVLSFGQHSWKFKKLPNKPVWESLRAFEDLDFPTSLEMAFLEVEQVKEARKSLNKRTRPIINWHATDDGYLSWEISQQAVEGLSLESN